MTRAPLQVSNLTLGRQAGGSPAESSYYVLVLFDIADSKKYRLLLRVLKRYAVRIQKSVFEAWLKPRQIKEMSEAIEGLMSSERYYDPDDNVRVYRMASGCTAVVYGTCATDRGGGDIFI